MEAGKPKRVIPRAPTAKYGWRAELDIAYAAAQALSVEERNERLHEATQNAIVALLPGAFTRCATFLRQTKDAKKVEVALSFLRQIKDSEDKYNRWMVERGKKKQQVKFDYKMLPQASAGKNGNGTAHEEDPEFVEIAYERLPNADATS